MKIIYIAALFVNEKGIPTPIISKQESKFSNLKAEHCTLQFYRDDNRPMELPAVIGHRCTFVADRYFSDAHIECISLKTDDGIVRAAAGGQRLHVTLSHDDATKPVASNQLIATGCGVVVPHRKISAVIAAFVADENGTWVY